MRFPRIPLTLEAGVVKKAVYLQRINFTKHINNLKTKQLKKLILALAVTFGLTSCSEDTIINNNYFEVEEVVITLDAQSLITESQSAFKYKTMSFDSTYQHIVPQTFTGYIVAQETKGQYTQHQVIKSIQVTEGLNQITVPKMKLKFYITNYNHPSNDEMQPNAWYCWNDAKQQLPQTSQNLFYLGSESEDFNSSLSITVQLENPYAAVMIKNNKWVNSAPSSYDTKENYFLDANTNWYVLYIRNNNTNTKVPINIPGNPNQHYTLSRSIEPNKSYQYTINGNVLEDDGNLNVVINPIEVGGSEEINL